MKNGTEKNLVVLEPYNPLDKRRIGEQVATALLAQPINPLPPEKFIGAGVYALYYTGDFPSYALLSAVNKGGKYRLPIYVGKAIPEGARKTPAWDWYHPGRAWAENLRPFSKTVEQLDAEIRSYLKCFFDTASD